MTIASILPVNADSTTTDAIAAILRHFGHVVVNTGHSLRVNAYPTEAQQENVVAFGETRGDILLSDWDRIGQLLPTDCYHIRFAR